MSGLAPAVALALVAAPATAAPDDPVHNQIQAFLNVIQSGGNFAHSEFKDAVKDADAARLRALARCDLDSVKRSSSGTSAIVLFRCPGAEDVTTMAVMMAFSTGKAVAIQPMSYVRIQERG